ncbi:MAG: hypothetical protein IKN41_03325, partial [Candidatus Methanomethylophilaceae archaeon]|nr:hypothetical protein [Candidatus Methanomethylophilaceae archaeon]
MDAHPLNARVPTWCDAHDETHPDILTVGSVPSLNPFLRSISTSLYSSPLESRRPIWHTLLPTHE